MTWYKDILHLFTKLSEQSFQNIIRNGSYGRAILNLVTSTVVLYVITYALPLIVKAISPALGIKRMTGLTYFDIVSAFGNASFLIFQIIIGAFVIWQLLILLGGTGTYKGVMGLILFYLSIPKHVGDMAYLVTMFSQYYAVFIGAQLMRRYVNLGIVKTYIVMFVVALLSVSVLPQWIRFVHTLVK